jgi:hypothetical protein
MLTSISLLIAPSLFHQIINAGESRPAAVRSATTLAGASLLPLTLALGISTFVTFDYAFNRASGTIVGLSLTAAALRPWLRIETRTAALFASLRFCWSTRCRDRAVGF